MSYVRNGVTVKRFKFLIRKSFQTYLFTYILTPHLRVLTDLPTSFLFHRLILSDTSLSNLHSYLSTLFDEESNRINNLRLSTLSFLCLPLFSSLYETLRLKTEVRCYGSTFRLRFYVVKQEPWKISGRIWEYMGNVRVLIYMKVIWVLTTRDQFVNERSELW